MDMLLHAADSLIAACEAKWLLVDEAVGAGRLPFCKAPGAFYIIAERAARRAGTYKDFRAKLPARAIEGEVSLSCAADAVGLVVRYDDGFEGSESRCLVRFDAGPRLRFSLGLDGRCRLDVVSGSD